MAGRSLARWQSLSPTYRSRLERGGISSADYLAGANLSSARGQARERERSQEVKEETGLSASALRAWKARARKVGVSAAKFTEVVATEGIELAVDGVRANERLRREYVSQGSPGGNVRKVLRREGFYNLSVADLDITGYLATEYDLVWGYYH